MVNTLRDYISKDIIDGVDRAYLKVISQSNNNEFFVDSFYQSDMDYKTIKNIMNHITDVAVEENEWLDGIYTYFSDSGVLVSTDGLIYKRGNRSNSLPEWMKSIIETDSEIIYVPTQPYDGIDILEDDNICMIVKPYPYITDYNGNAAMKLCFKNVTGGFYTVDKEGNRTQTPEPAGFLIADNTGEFKIANAVINDDNTITVWNEEVQTPAYVRYAFEGFPYPEFANIYTENGLPLTPFRTDDINVEYSYDRAAMGGDVNLLLNGDFEIVDATGKTFTGYYTHRITNVNYGGVTAGTWENETEEFGKYYADMTLYNGTGNANTQVYTAITGTKENARIPIRAGKYIIQASVDATFTDPSTELCMQMGFYSNDEKGMGNYYTNEQEWKVTESTDGMVDVVGKMIIGEEYDGCYLYAFGPRLVTKSSEMQNVKIDNIVFRRVEE